MKKSNMYLNTKTWNPFKGCLYDCSYCIPSFQKQAKRQMHNCMKCYEYTPHYHPERLNKIPKAETIFVCGNSDISFCEPSYIQKIIDAIKNKNKKNGEKNTYYFQSKNPLCLQPFLSQFPNNVILITTLETNKDIIYKNVSKAPLPSVRYNQFLNLNYPRKVVTIEPIMDFDLDIFSTWILNIKPEYVWMGFNTRRKQISLIEPDKNKVKKLISVFNDNKIKVNWM